MISNLFFQDSRWFILLCLAVGIAYALVLYTKKSTLSKSLNRILGIGRTLLVAGICFLLLNPLLKSNSIRTLKPILVIALDNSASMNQLGSKRLYGLKSEIKNAITSLQASDFQVDFKVLSGESKSLDIDSVVFDTKKTEFGGFFQDIKEEYSGQNLSNIVLISDGMVNTGVSVQQREFPFTIDAIGYGDTTVKRDLAIKGLRANKLAYLGNDFPVQVDISAELFKGKGTTVIIRQEDEIVAREIVNFSSDSDFKSLNFNLSTKEIGKQRYTVTVLPLGGESNTRNNGRDIVVDVVDGKEKILLVAAFVHPDIKAFKAIIEKNPLFDLTIKIVQQHEAREIEREEFDILILHQLPDGQGQTQALTTRLLAKLKPTMFIIGANTDLNRFNGMQEVVGISNPLNRLDKVTGAFNTSFTRFIANDNYTTIISKLPPVTAPFGVYNSFPGSNVILFQKVGNLQTTRPLLAVNTNAARKAAVLSAEGLWQWRMEEYFNNEAQEAVDDYILKTLQLISVKEDKEKLRVYPVQNEVGIDELVIFETESYNDLYEKITDSDIEVKLDISGPASYNKSFNYVANGQNRAFEVSDLKAGVYSYKAEGKVLNVLRESSGQFVVKDKDLESLNMTADFDLLRTLALKNGGEFYTQNTISDLKDKLTSTKVPSRLINTEDLREIINLWWLLPLLLLLASTEWGLRKYFGSY
ncbi:MAG: hypothetical protein ACI9IP_003242 [Arcticibacterium sp.]|jgi:hypothetical protein